MGQLDGYFIQQFVPLAYSYTAGLLKAAAKAFDSVKPTVELRQNDSQGNIIAADGAGGGTIYVKAVDPAGSEPGGNPAYPVPAGIYRLALKNLDTGAAIAPAPAIAAMENPSIRTFSGLAEGRYELKALDGLGNETSVLFRRSGRLFSLDRLG